MTEKDISTIMAMLSYKRPAGSPGEKTFINRFLRPLKPKTDDFGNLFVTIGKNPSILWSSHTDSVHWDTGKQDVVLKDNFVHLTEDSKSNCLGSDDAAGVWIMMEMIKASVPGLYIFHSSEEIGCLGSRFIRNKTPHVLDGIKAAVAFDRRDVHSVITHQGKRCCSDAFGISMAKQLPARFKLDDTGFVTDTKIYLDVVPECTNISVGYYNEHSPNEKLDIAHLIELRDHMVKIDASKFVIERDPHPLTKFKSLFGNRENPTTIYDLIWVYPSEVAEVLEEAGIISFEELKSEVNSLRALNRQPLKLSA